nr:MAG TPA: homing endonuclease [Caudoviricetes sp.]
MQYRSGSSVGGRKQLLPPMSHVKELAMQEQWKDIPGYEGRYQASTLGHIRSVSHRVRIGNLRSGKECYRIMRGCVLKPGKYCKSGHVSVVLGHKATGTPVHQLIMLTFVGPPPAGMEVLHINGVPTDNQLSNLRYGTRTENILDVYRQGGVWRKLSIEDVETIRFSIFCRMKGSALAEIYGVSQTTISAVKRGRSFKWLK